MAEKSAPSKSGGSQRVPTKIGPYQILKTIGKGNFAVVKLAEHTTAKMKVLICFFAVINISLVS